MGMAATIPYYTVEDLAHFPNDGNRYELLDGVLLVPPPPSVPHEVVVSRINQILIAAVQLPGYAFVFTHGAVSLLPRTQLEPDLLVVPADVSPNSKWHEITEHWLAVEVISRSSRIYDREFKRDAYLALGVREVWLVDRDDRSVDVTRVRGEVETVRDTIIWRDVRVSLRDIFAGID
jgi:Uma2 family endonuclease